MCVLYSNFYGMLFNVQWKFLSGSFTNSKNKNVHKFNGISNNNNHVRRSNGHAIGTLRLEDDGKFPSSAGKLHITSVQLAGGRV